MNLNEEVDCNSSLDAPLRPEPAQCSHHLRCALNEGHGDDAGPNDIAHDHWAPHGGALQVKRDGIVGSTGAYWKSEASVTGARSLPVDDLADGEEVLELARMILADPYRNDHLLNLDETGWTLKHPIAERLQNQLFDCEFNPLSDLLAEEWSDEANQAGVYKVEIIPTPTGPVLGLQRIPDA